VKVTRFDPADSLIIVTGWIHGPRGAKPVSLAFDTAATETPIIPEILDDIDDFRIHVHDLPETLGIQGLLGLSFLRRLNYEIRSAEGRIPAARI